MSELIQGSDAWLKMRKNKIGASDCPVILGISPWQTSWDLWREKLDLIPPKEENERMKEGKRLEPIALAIVNSKLGINLQPDVLFSEERSWQMASLDGWNDGYRVAVEIKCGGEKLYSMAKNKNIPDYYMAQMQHQMSVCGITKMFYFSFFDNDGILIEVKRDDKLIYESILPKEEEFWNCLQNLEEPALCEKDYIERTDEEWKRAVQDWHIAHDGLKKFKENEEEARKRLISLSEGKNVIGSGVRLTKSLRRGQIDYKAIPELLGIDTEKYRKPPIETWRLGEV